MLHALLERSQQWQHGYLLSKALDIPGGTLYPILIRLEDRGYLEARWEEGSTNLKRSYRLTPEGRRYAAECLEESRVERAIEGLAPYKFE